MNINDLRLQLKNQTESGMTAVNVASMPFRALNVVVGGLVHLAASSHPVAQETIGKVGRMIDESWKNSTIGKGWNATRLSIINDFKKLDIPESRTSYFLDSVEELVLAGGTAGIGSFAKAAAKNVMRFSAYIKRSQTGFPAIENIRFKPGSWSEYIPDHRFAINKPGEGFIDYHYAKGSQNSVLFYLDYIQKGKVSNHMILTPLNKIQSPYATSKAAMAEIISLAKQMGSDRIFLQFQPENPKFLAFVKNHYEFKGWHKIQHPLGVSGARWPLPVFELTAPLAANSSGSVVANLVSRFKPRIDLEKGYLKSKAEFSRYSEFIGTLNRDLVVVRYHDANAFANHSWSWWTSTHVANSCNTLNKVKDRLALLDSFGEKSHVTVARIPRGTQIQVLHGRAKPQMAMGEYGHMEIRPGGGYQMRFKDFNESWIKTTCSLTNPADCIKHPIWAAGTSATAFKFVKLTSPFAATETMHVLTTGSYNSQDQFNISLISPVKASDYIPVVVPPKVTMQQTPSDLDKQLGAIRENLIDFSGQMTGIKPAIEEFRKLHDTMVVFAKNPAQGPIKLVSQILNTPGTKIKILLQGPQNILKGGKLFLNNPTFMGAVGVCGSILSVIESVTWAIEFMRDPKHMAKATLKAPITTVKTAAKMSVALIRDPRKTAIFLCKSVIKAPVETVKGFLRAIGLKKRKKKRSAPQPRVLSPQEKTRIMKKYTNNLTALYGCAKVNWFIEPFKTLEEYHQDLLKDWEHIRENRIHCKHYVDFPAYLKAKFDQRDFNSIMRLSPRAHPKAAIPPVEVISAYEDVGKAFVEVKAVSKVLDTATQVKAAVYKDLNAERASLDQNVTQLKTLIDNNEDKIKQALRARLSKKKQ